jgi:hypothetical protein
VGWARRTGIILRAGDGHFSTMRWQAGPEIDSGAEPATPEDIAEKWQQISAGFWLYFSNGEALHLRRTAFALDAPGMEEYPELRIRAGKSISVFLSGPRGRSSLWAKPLLTVEGNP